ncbi:MAG: SAM-dependent methyltransferase [Lentisphaeria bacterium]|nr:SAM-dependent methyltransferase [Lentisphaeria bacterium]
MTIRLGTRSSRLALLQAEAAAAFLRTSFPGLDISILPFSSPGDRDKQLDLRESPDDFFTRDLDEAVAAGSIDAAVHSAKDLPDPVPEGLDWCWLPRPADPRDVLITRGGWNGEKPPVMGVSSARRADFVRGRFPNARQKPIRGAIEERLRQLDEGHYDVLVMAGCALTRLGIVTGNSDLGIGNSDLGFAEHSHSEPAFTRLRRGGRHEPSTFVIPCSLFNIPKFQESDAECKEERHDPSTLDVQRSTSNERTTPCEAAARFYEWISLDALPVPEGQGYLAMTFREGDQRFQRMRTAWLHPVQFVSAGCGGADQITLAGRQALSQCDVCYYDALLDDDLLTHLPPGARAVYVGKRAHKNSIQQQTISELLRQSARQGKNVARLKGGDAGIFGRLAEEIECLDSLGLPFRVHPGISALTAASTGSGLLLTRRGVTDGFQVLTGTSVEDYDPAARTEVIFMGSRKLAQLCAERLSEGRSPDTPVCLALAVGTDERKFVFGSLGNPPPAPDDNRPGLVLVGGTADPKFLYPEHGPLRGQRVWLTCSEAMQGRTAPIVWRLGGVPIRKPLIRLVPTDVQLPDLTLYDWVILTSPSSVDCLLRQVGDLRHLPKLLVCGKGTQTHLKTYRIQADAYPAYGFSTEGVLRTAREIVPPDAAILRLRSELAGTRLSDALRPHFARVDDVVLYTNQEVDYEHPPACDVVFFASSSGVASLVRQFGADFCRDKICLPLGKMDAEAMEKHGIEPVFVPSQATAAQALQELADWLIRKELGTMKI